jgi:hypothetical protein
VGKGAQSSERATIPVACVRRAHAFWLTSLSSAGAVATREGKPV